MPVENLVHTFPALVTPRVNTPPYPPTMTASSAEVTVLLVNRAMLARVVSPPVVVRLSRFPVMLDQVVPVVERDVQGAAAPDQHFVRERLVQDGGGLVRQVLDRGQPAPRVEGEPGGPDDPGLRGDQGAARVPPLEREVLGRVVPVPAGRV